MSNLGKRAKDMVTGFEGVITSKHEYLMGSSQYGIQATTVVDGKEPAILYLNENRVLIMDQLDNPDDTKAGPGN